MLLPVTATATAVSRQTRGGGSGRLRRTVNLAPTVSAAGAFSLTLDLACFMGTLGPHHITGFGDSSRLPGKGGGSAGLGWERKGGMQLGTAQRRRRAAHPPTPEEAPLSPRAPDSLAGTPLSLKRWRNLQLLCLFLIYSLSSRECEGLPDVQREAYPTQPRHGHTRPLLTLPA